MAGKRLDELKMSELKSELEKIGVFGSFSEAQAIVKLTIYLVSIRKDPFTFQFQPCNSTVADDGHRESTIDVESPVDTSADMFVLFNLGETVEDPKMVRNFNEPLNDASEDTCDNGNGTVAFDVVNAVRKQQKVLLYENEDILVKEILPCEKVKVSVPELADVESVVTSEETENGYASVFLTASQSTSLKFL